MVHIQRDAARFALALAIAALPMTVQAQGQAQGQGGSGWFVPEQGKPGTAPAKPVARPPAPAPRPQIPGPQGPGSQAPGSQGPGSQAPGLQAPGDAINSLPPGAGLAPEGMVDPNGQSLPPLQVQLPPMPEVPMIPKGSPTPAAIVGILSVPDVLRVSSAYQQADKELSARRARLSDDAQKEQTMLRDLGQAFANERAKLTPEQIRAREKEYAERVNESRRKFSERDRINQEAGQYVMMQINRVVEQVAQQVAASRGVNLVLNRGQVLGTTADFDLTPQVADVTNRMLPAVVIPPDGVSPTKFTAPVAGPRANAAPDATPAKKN